MDVEALCRQLNGEPLLHLSLGSKELFHSNLLAWMCQRFPAESVRILEPWLHSGAGDTLEVRREYKNLDLVVSFPRFAPLVVENKMFSLPDVEQLRTYSKGNPGKIGPDAALMLLSLTDPGWPNDRLEIEGKVWQYVPWSTLAQRLLAEFGNMAGFEAQVLAHEANFLHLLHRLTELVSVTSPDGPFLLPKTAIEPLRSIRVADAVGKIRGYQVMHRIRSRYAAAGLHPSRTEVGLTNGTPLMSAYWVVDDAGNAVGWQCQGNQWRLAMILASMAGKEEAKIAQRASYAATQVDWFHFGPLCKILGASDYELRPVTLRDQPEGFNRYNPDFVYRYRRIPPDTTVGQVEELAVEYARAAAAWKFDPPPVA